MDRTCGMLEIEAERLSSDGRAVGRTPEGIAVFIRGALPGQRVLARAVQRKRNFIEAEAVRVMRPASGERPPACPHAGGCGGCPWQCLPYREQLRWKRSIVVDALNRIGHLGLPSQAVPEPLFARDGTAPAEWRFRNKMEFCFAEEDGQTLLGLRARASRRVFDVRQCLLMPPRAMDVLEELRRLCAAQGLRAAPDRPSAPSAGGKLSVLRFAVVRMPRAGGCLLELITLPAPHLADAFRTIGKALLSSPCGITGFVHSVRASRSAVASGEKTVLTLGGPGLEEVLHIGGRSLTFRLGHASFFQVNTSAAEILYGTAERMAGEMFGGKEPWGQDCWDIYCGVGGLALTFAPHFKRIFGMEISRQAAGLAGDNAALNGLPAGSCRFAAGDASALERSFAGQGVPDLLVTDPPRAGMDPQTTASILRHRPPHLLLVSCDPATLARDLALLAPSYALRAIQPVDLFPQTPHVETVCALERR